MNDVKNRLVIGFARMLPSRFVQLGIKVLKRKFVIGVVCVALDSEGRVLVQRQTYDTPPWRLPGGLRERHESVYETAVREVWEESCCEVSPLAIVHAQEAVVTFDICVLADITQVHPFIANAEVSERALLHPDELPPLSPQQALLVEDAIRLRRQLSGSAPSTGDGAGDA